MGDLLQTTPMIAGLKHKYPDSHLTLVVIDDFRGICSGFQGVDRIMPIDVNRLVPRLIDAKFSLEEHYTSFNKVVNRIKDDYDLVINLSHSRLSAVFARLMDCKDTRGITLTQDGALIVKHPWLNYFFYVSQKRLYNTFNLVDMYNMTGDIDLNEAKLHYQVPTEAVAFAHDFLKDYQGKFIGFQMGASTGDRKWNPEYFAKLAEIIKHRLGWNIIVFGSRNERELLERMQKKYTGPLIDAVGETSMQQLGALLQRCELLITNDTGTMHLAAALGTVVIAVFLGEAHAGDTGPYTEKAVILEANIPCAPCSYQTECKDHVCHKYIQPQDVFQAIENFSQWSSGEIPQFKDSEELSKIQVSHPVFENDGFFYLAPLIRRPLTIEILLKILYRRMWKKFLNPHRKNHPTEIEKYYAHPDNEAFFHKLPELETVFGELSSLGSRGVDIAARLKSAASPPHVHELKLLSIEMIKLDNAIYHLELTHPETMPIALSFRIRKNNAEKDDLDHIINLAHSLYSGVQQQAELMASEIQSFNLKKAEILAEVVS